MPKKTKNDIVSKARARKDGSKIYTLCVYLIGGPVSDEFEDIEISRTIQIRGNQILQQLHKIIFKAFNRDDDHLYEFNLGEGPSDRSEIYALSSSAFEWLKEEEGDVNVTTIESLGLEVGRAFGYWYDFGDDWLHQINVVAVDDSTGSGKYPLIIEQVGKSPPSISGQRFHAL